MLSFEANNLAFWGVIGIAVFESHLHNDLIETLNPK